MKKRDKIMEKRAARKAKKENKPKTTYLEWYEKDKERWRQIRKSPWFYYFCLLPVVLIASFFIQFERMGEQALTYSDEVYNNIKVVMDQSLKKGFGVDSKILQGGIDIEEEIDGKKTGHIDHYDGVDQYADAYSENGHILEATVKNGYFEATVGTRLDENFQSTATWRNFGNARAYMEHYGMDLGLSFVYGFGAWAVLGIVLNFLTGVIESICSRRLKKKEEAEKATADAKAAEEKTEKEKAEIKADEKEEPEKETKAEEKAAEITDFPVPPVTNEVANDK